MLNLYFSEWSEYAKKYHRIIDKYIGDAVMIVFENSNKQTACKMAVSCAIDMFSKVKPLNEKLKNNGLPQLEGIGIGIHFGDVIAGDIGSLDRANYTYIGDNVNVTSRIESLTKRAKKHILISKDVYLHLDEETQKDFIKTKQAIKLKGRKNTVYIYYYRHS